MLADRTDPRAVFLVGSGHRGCAADCLQPGAHLSARRRGLLLFSIGAGFIETVTNIVPTRIEPEHPGSLMNMVHTSSSIVLARPLRGRPIYKAMERRPVDRLVAGVHRGGPGPDHLALPLPADPGPRKKRNRPAARRAR